MSRVKISELAAATTSVRKGNTNRDAGKVIIPLVDGKTTKSITVDNLFESAGSISSSVGIDVQGPVKSTSLITSGSTEFSGSTDISGSTTISGSFEQSGSSTFTGGGFNVNNLLDLLSNFGQTGIPTGSGEGGVAEGDINLDGQVNVNDILLLLAGYGNPNQICQDQTIPPNINHQYVGPTISICSGSTLSISAGSFCSITN